MRLFAPLAALLAPICFALAPTAWAQEGSGVAVAIALDLPQGGSSRAGLASIEPIRTFVRGRPGLVEERLLQGQVDSANDFIHLTVWERLEDWEALFEDQAFLDLLSATDPQFEPSLAEVYTSIP